MGYDYVAPNKKGDSSIHDIIAGKINSITFTSPPSVRDLIKIAEAIAFRNLEHSLNTSVIVVAVGPSTKTGSKK
jgi:uroporphyrinogen-III synthase